MSQNPIMLPTQGTISGTQLVTLINQSLDTLLTLNAGSSQPSSPAEAYMLWLDTSTAPPTLRIHDGVQWVALGALDTTNHLWTPPVGGGKANLTSAATTDLGSVPQAAIQITGTTTIASLGASAAPGQLKFVDFAGALTLTHNAVSLILPGAANIVTAAGDVAIFESLGAGNWRCLAYQPASGKAVVADAMKLQGRAVSSAAPTDGQVLTYVAANNDWEPGSASSVNVPVRQTVLSGATDANGLSSFLSSGGGLVLNVSANAVPIVVAFAAGFGGGGAIDYVGRVTADAQIGLGASLTSYIYLDRNPSTGALSFGGSSLQPIYQQGGSPSVANTQHTYIISQGQMYVGNGTSASVVQRIFLGEATTNASAITSVTAYALQGRYASPATSMPAVNSGVIIACNIGADPRLYDTTLKIANANNVWSPSIINFIDTGAGGGTRGADVKALDRNQIQISVSADLNFTPDGQINFPTQFIVKASRGW